MEENKTTRANKNVNYYSDRPDYDNYQEKDNCHCEKPEYDYRPERPNYDHCPVKPEYDCHKERPKYDHCPERPNYDQYKERPKYNQYKERPNYDQYEERPKYNQYKERPNYDQYEERPKHDCCDDKHECHDNKHDCHDNKHDCCDNKHDCNDNKHDCHDNKHDCNDNKHDCHDNKHDCNDNKHDCHDNKHDCNDNKHDCHDNKHNCCCCHDQVKVCKNGCMKCCNPLSLKCPDISCAVCTPILTDRIFDVKHINKELDRVVDPPEPFNVAPRPANCPPYVNGAPVCIEKVAVSFSCLGFTSDKLPITIDTVADKVLTAATQLSCSSECRPLFTSYEGTIIPNLLCCDEGRCVNLIQHPATDSAAIVNVSYTVTGFIGCEPFTATLGPFTVKFDPPFPAVTLFSNICLPQTTEEVNLKAKFKLNYVVKCIRALETFVSNPTRTSAGTFHARIFDELEIKEKFLVSKKDELVVFSSPDGFKHHEK